jgi:hypothetical protein
MCTTARLNPPPAPTQATTAGKHTHACTPCTCICDALISTFMRVCIFACLTHTTHSWVGDFGQPHTWAVKPSERTKAHTDTAQSYTRTDEVNVSIHSYTYDLPCIRHDAYACLFVYSHMHLHSPYPHTPLGWRAMRTGAGVQWKSLGCTRYATHRQLVVRSNHTCIFYKFVILFGSVWVSHIRTTIHTDSKYKDSLPSTDTPTHSAALSDASTLSENALEFYRTHFASEATPAAAAELKNTHDSVADASFQTVSVHETQVYWSIWCTHTNSCVCMWCISLAVDMTCMYMH